MALELAQYTSANARVEADSIAAGLPQGLGTGGAGRGAGSREANREASARVLREHEITLQGGFVIVYREGKAVLAFHMPQRVNGATAEVKPWMPDPAPADEDSMTAAEREKAELSVTARRCHGPDGCRDPGGGGAER